MPWIMPPMASARIFSCKRSLTTPWFSIWGYRKLMALHCCGSGATQASRLQCSYSRRAVAGTKRCRGLTAARMITCRSRFRLEEVLARLRALIRRASGHLTPELRTGSVTLDAWLARVTLDGASVKLTSHEFRVLSYMMHQGGRVVSQAELIEHIYAQDFDRDSNTVEVFIARLRRKLGPSFIETVRGHGYRIA
jgi:hypothetical protein